MARPLARGSPSRCVGLAVFGYVFNVLVVEREQAWQFGQYFNRHTIHEGGLAAGALAIGLGLGPVVGRARLAVAA